MRIHKPTVEPLEARIAPAVFTVTNLLNSGQGSLRAALVLADGHPGHNTIVFHLLAPPAHSENIINLASELATDGNVTIAGPGAGRLIINGAGASRVLLIDNTTSAADSPVTVSGLSIVNGSATTNGGGILSYESLTPVSYTHLDVYKRQAIDDGQAADGDRAISGGGCVIN